MRLTRRTLAALVAVPVLVGGGAALSQSLKDDPVDHEAAARIHDNQPAIAQFRSLSLPRGVAPCTPYNNPGPTGIDDIGVVCLTARVPAVALTTSLRRLLQDVGATAIQARCVTAAVQGPVCGLEARIAGRPFGLTVSESKPGTATAGLSRAFGGLPPLDRFGSRTPLQRLPTGSPLPLP